jgi:creatinine amidohydrolase
VRKDQIKSGVISFNEENSPFNWVDLFAAGPRRSSRGRAAIPKRAFWAMPNWPGRKGTAGLREAVQTTGAIRDLVPRPSLWTCAAIIIAKPPTMPMPWGQEPIK